MKSRLARIRAEILIRSLIRKLRKIRCPWDQCGGRGHTFKQCPLRISIDFQVRNTPNCPEALEYWEKMQKDILRKSKKRIKMRKRRTFKSSIEQLIN
jgi:hypothetical protein